MHRSRLAISEHRTCAVATTGKFWRWTQCRAFPNVRPIPIPTQWTRSTLTCGCDDEDEVLDGMSCLSECPGGEQERNGQCSDCPMERWSPAGGSCTTCTGGTISAGQDSCACPGNLVYHKSEFGGGRCQCPETGAAVLNAAADMCVSECPAGSEVGTSEVPAFRGTGSVCGMRGR